MSLGLVTLRVNISHTVVDWPYCNAARQLTSVIMKTTDWSQWDSLKYRRRIETFGMDDGPGTAHSTTGNVCEANTL